MIMAIARRELRSLFATPLPWVFLALSQGLLAWDFFSLLQRYMSDIQPQLVRLTSVYGATDLVAVAFLESQWLIFSLLLALAMLAMRALAEERAGHTLSLLLAAPVSSLQVVLGKYLGALLFLLLVLGLWGLLPLSLALGTGLDLGRLGAGLLGLALFAAALLALAVWVSSLTARPAVAAVLAFVLSAVLLRLQPNPQAVEQGGSVLAYLNPLLHYLPFLGGTVATVDLAYFGLFIVGFLALAVRQVDSLRVQA